MHLLNKISVRYFRYELAVSLYNQLQLILSLGIAGVVACYIMFVDDVHFLAMVTWSGSMLGLLVAAQIILVWSAKRPTLENYVHWCYRVLAFFTAIAVGWSALAVILLPELRDWQQLCFLFIMFTVIAVPLPIYNYCLPVTLLNPLIIHLVSALAFLFSDDFTVKSVVTMVVLYAAALMFIIKNIEIAKGLIQAVDNAHLIADKNNTISRLEHDSQHDLSTGLLNANGIQQYLQKLSKINNQFYVITIKARQVADLYLSNDRFTADALVKILANRLHSRLTNSEAISHNGLGDFTLVGAFRERSNDVRQRAEALCLLFDEPINLMDEPVSIHASFGFAQYPKDTQNIEDLTVLSMTAMQHADTQSGTSIVAYQPELSLKVSDTLAISRSLANAIQQNEFQLHLQPKYNLITNKVMGAEALIRWRSKKLGYLSPAEFIPVAESTGYIIPLGFWILDEADRILALESLPAGFVLSINVSLKQFDDSRLVDNIIKVSRRAKQSGKVLEVEITESMLMSEGLNIEQTLGRLAREGVPIALDDFGTGYSALSYLTRLKVNSIKLDKSFIDSVPCDPTHSQLVSSLIQLSNALGLELVAEGVESEEQFHWLKQHGCDIVQGYYVAKPMEESGFLKWLASNELSPL